MSFKSKCADLQLGSSKKRRKQRSEAKTFRTFAASEKVFAVQQK